MLAKDIQAFATRLSTIKNPRVARGFVDSFYAQTVSGRIKEMDAGAVERLAKVLVEYGFESHAKKLLAHTHYKDNALYIDSTCKFEGGKHAGYTTLNLGRRIVNQNKYGTVYSPLSSYVVKGHIYNIGQKLERLPEGAVPVEEVFPE